MARTDGVWEIIAGAIRPIGEDGYSVLVYGTNRYLNFNTLYGTSGYGFRDNAGVMEYKNSGGSWATFSGGGGGSGDVTGPASSTDGNFAVFDGVTGKIIKDGGTPGDLATLNEVGVDEVSDDIALACTDQHAITDYTFTGTERRNGGYLVTTASNRTVNIDADLFTTGVEFSFCKGTDNANTVTLDAGSGNNINGSQTLVITQYNELITLIKDGANTWKVKSHYYPGIKDALDGKLDKNTPITGATKTKVTYDADGLVTGGADATTADIADSSNKRYVTDAQLTVIGSTSGTNTGDQDLSSYATKTGSETLTNKTLTKPVINGSIQGVTADTDGTTITFDMASSNMHTVTLGGNRILTLSNVSVGQVFTIRLQQDATGSRTVTWFTTIKRAGGTAPTLTTTASKADLFVFVCTGSGTYDGTVAMSNL